MTLVEKLFAIYPELEPINFGFDREIDVRNNADGRGDYIAKWEHPTLAQPTQEQLDAAGEA